MDIKHCPQPEREIIPMPTETGHLDDELSVMLPDVESDRRQFILHEPNLMRLDALLSESNDRILVDEFMKTLRYALLSTLAIKGNQIVQIILRGGILQNMQDLSDLFSLDIELVIVLDVESYSLSEILLELAEEIYGDILCAKGLFFIKTVLSQREWNNIAPDQDEYLILVEKESALPNSLHKYQLSPS